MSFLKSVRIDALVKSARRCCVCNRYKGVGVEVHHIESQASSGPDTLDNAIVLCFDCHTAAGHYNPKHPRGTKFSPKELRRHRDKWWARVEAAGNAELASENLPEYYVRHLICMDYSVAKELLRGEKKHIPFDFNFLEENLVADFMRHVLKDKLPFTWAQSSNSEGNYWGDKGHDSLEAFHNAHPDFDGADWRPIKLTDFSQTGIQSKLLLQCFNEGLSGENLGRAILYEDVCGGGGYTYYYSVRRPIFVFAQIENASNLPIVLTALLSDRREFKELRPMPFSESISDPTERDTAPLKLAPGQSVLIPEVVLLTDPHIDDYTTIWSEYKNISSEQGQDFSFKSSSSKTGKDYFLVGPSESLFGFKATCKTRTLTFPVHGFDPDLCYMMARYWHVGSCPHVFFETTDRAWIYGGEILSDGFFSEAVSEITVPPGVRSMRISEVDEETTRLRSLEVNGQEMLRLPTTLRRGEILDLDVKEGDRIKISGSYSAIISKPSSPAHIRQKNSMLNAVFTSMNMER